MNHIYEINKAVEGLRKRAPKHEFFIVLRQYMDKGKMDYYRALDSLGFELGINALTYYGFREEPGGWMAPGWYACVGFEEKNPLSQIEHETDLRWFSEERYVDGCIYAIKKQIKAMMKVPDLAECVFAEL